MQTTSAVIVVRGDVVIDTRRWSSVFMDGRELRWIGSGRPHKHTPPMTEAGSEQRRPGDEEENQETR